MADDLVDATGALDFVLLRAPEPVGGDTLRVHYISDGELLTEPGVMTHVPPPPTVADYSWVGRLVFEHVYAQSPPADPLTDLRDALLDVIGPSVFQPGSTGPQQRVRLEDLTEHAVIYRSGLAYVLPDTLDRVGSDLVHHLAALRMQFALLPGSPLPAVTKLAREVLNTTTLRSLVFTDKGAHSDAYAGAQRALFDTLYLLYVLRRWVAVDLGQIIAGLRLLHLLEALAVDELYERCKAAAPNLDPVDATQLGSLRRRYPGLATWDGKSEAVGFPLVRDPALYLDARPVVHPIFAQLFWFRAPFNDLKPLGVGDFKLVKQWLVEYIPGEICDIHNVMKGETKERTHRRLERTEETFSFSSDREEETTRDTQTTDRFELKREIEATLKKELSVNANATVTYNGSPVVATIAGGFAYNRADGSSEKVAQSLSREVIAKAVSRVQTRTSQTRSTTKVFETEETNKHTLAAPGAHISGIYRWVDKRYRAQVFNYGRRMMFELVLPEPAEFLVTARIAAFEDALDYPEMPSDPSYATLVMPVTSPAAITPQRFEELRLAYDLSEFTFPVTQKTFAIVDTSSGAALIKESSIDASDQWHASGLRCSLKGVTGYEVARITVTGKVQFDDNNPNPVESDRNITRMDVDGTTVWFYQEDHVGVIFGDRRQFLPDSPYTFVKDDVDIVLAFQDVEAYRLIVSIDVTLGAQGLLDWQTRVYQAIQLVEQKKVEAANRDAKLVHDAAMSTYTNRIAELKATALNDLLRGQSEQANADLIRTELRRQCLAMITKELAAYGKDDFLTKWDTTATRKVSRDVTRLKVTEIPGDTTVAWETTQLDTAYPVPDVAASRARGRHVQFLEQAFDWDNISWIFYPYFWASPPTWVQRLARADQTDPNLTAFLQAGSARVLVAVTPAYDDAVLHYLCTREPWDGGAAPVIGDPLYLPLHEELRRQQDDRYGAKPEGESWDFTVPTMLTYLHGSSDTLPDLIAERKAREDRDKART